MQYIQLFLVLPWQIIVANLALLGSSLAGGVCIRYPGEIGQRRAFMETRKCIETRIKITKVSSPIRVFIKISKML